MSHGQVLSRKDIILCIILPICLLLNSLCQVLKQLLFCSTAIDKADVLLSMKHGIVRLDDVWGVCGGNRPVKYLVKRVRILPVIYITFSSLILCHTRNKLEVNVQ